MYFSRIPFPINSNTSPIFIDTLLVSCLPEKQNITSARSKLLKSSSLLISSEFFTINQTSSIFFNALYIELSSVAHLKQL
jgi:hypothetical protein